MIRIVEGNLLEANEQIIGHQVNCKFVMGAGLAKLIRNKYPVVYESYMELKEQNEEVLGKVQMVYVGNSKYVANIFGQYGYGRYGLHTNYEALERALKELRKHAEEFKMTVALPYGLGSGLAGGKWETVYGIINQAFDGYEVTLYKFQ